MAATILSGTVTPTGNYTLYTNNTNGNVRLIIHSLFIYGQPSETSRYRTKRVNITGGSHGTLSLPSSAAQVTNTDLTNIRVQIGKGLAMQDSYDPVTEKTAANASEPAGAVEAQSNIYINGMITSFRRDALTNLLTLANGPQSFPTEIMLRNGQAIQFEAPASTAQQYISFNITVMPEGG